MSTKSQDVKCRNKEKNKRFRDVFWTYNDPNFPIAPALALQLFVQVCFGFNLCVYYIFNTQIPTRVKLQRFLYCIRIYAILSRELYSCVHAACTVLWSVDTATCICIISTNHNIYAEYCSTMQGQGQILTSLGRVKKSGMQCMQ